MPKKTTKKTAFWNRHQQKNIRNLFDTIKDYLQRKGLHFWLENSMDMIHERQIPRNRSHVGCSDYNVAKKHFTPTNDMWIMS